MLGGVGREPGPAAGATFYRRLAAWQIAALALCWQEPFAAETVRRGAVSGVIDGDTVVLESGAEVRLVGIQAPKLALGRPGFRNWPLAAEARKALEALVLGAPVKLVYGGRRVDRHRRLLAHLEREATSSRAAVWVQGEMLRTGFARVYTFPDNRARAARMLALEREARAARRGIWRLRYYRILSPEETRRYIGSFRLVDGTVLDAAIVRGRGYLNFGPDWRSDFTVSVERKYRRRFRRAGIDIGALTGRRVRVRGWLAWQNGPMIEATHPEQLELIEP